MVKLEQHKLVNKNSNFFIVSYWWGRGNVNKNTQRPCDAENPKKKGLTYDKVTDRLIESCVKNNVNYYIIEKPEFVGKLGYQKAINYKPTFVLEALKKVNELYKSKNQNGFSIAYIDTDMLVNSYPHIFDRTDIDYMTYMWNVEARQTKENIDCLKPWLFETSGGLQFFANTPSGKRLARLWKEDLTDYPGKADDRILSMAFVKHQAELWCRSLWMPFEFLYFSSEVKRGETVNPDYKIKSPSHKVISHPECLTSEETSHELGADSDRVPSNYSKYIDWDADDICQKYDSINEDLIFSDKIETETFSGLRKTIVSEKLAPYNTYGKNAGKKYIEETMKEVENLPIEIGSIKKWFVVTDKKQSQRLVQDGNKIICNNETTTKKVLLYLVNVPNTKVICSLIKSSEKILKDFGNSRETSQLLIKFLKSGFSYGVPPNVNTRFPIVVQHADNRVLYLLSKWLRTKKSLGEILRENPHLTLLTSIN